MTGSADLEIGLQAPDGTTVMLADNAGGSGRDFTGTILDDEASVSIASATAANAPFTGRWRPAQPLSAFDGKPIAGTWHLRVRDVATPDPGIVHSFSLLLPECNIAPKAALSASPATAVRRSADAARRLGIERPRRRDHRVPLGLQRRRHCRPRDEHAAGDDDVRRAGHRRVFGDRRRRARADRQPRAHRAGASALRGCRRRDLGAAAGRDAQAEAQAQARDTDRQAPARDRPPARARLPAPAHRATAPL